MQSGTKVVILYGAGATLVALVLLVMMAIGFANASVAVLKDFAAALPERAAPAPGAKRAPPWIGPSLPDVVSAIAMNAALDFDLPRVRLAPTDDEWPWFRVAVQAVKWLHARPYF